MIQHGRLRIVWPASLLMLLCVAPAMAATPAEVQRFLHGQTHGQLPYALPAETNWQELDRVLAHKFDVVGVMFCGPYGKGRIDFAALDEAVARIDRAGSRALVHVMPRFEAGEGIADTLSDCTRIEHAWNRNPNYSIIDVFDPPQAGKFNDYLGQTAKRYGHDKRVAGFCICWGYQGETGFFTGDFNAGFEQMGSVSAGYSTQALREFNRWRADRGLAAVPVLPLPNSKEQLQDFIDFMHFRFDWLSNRFQAQAVQAMKAHTDRPIGLFAYLPADKNSYARQWCPTPGADFYRSAGSAASYDLPRTLSDSGIGWEDSQFHAGRWDFTFAAMRRDEARMIAHGASFHAMLCRHYSSEKQWEPGIYDKVCRFLAEEAPGLRQKVSRAPADVGLFLPTWSCAAWPGHSDKQPFLPPAALGEFMRLHVGIVESFGLRYRLLTEEDLLRDDGCAGLKLVLIVAGNHLDRALGPQAFKRLKASPNVEWLDYQGKPAERSRIRQVLAARQLAAWLDYDGEQPIAGMVQNVLFNFRPEPTTVRYRTGASPQSKTLAGHAVEVIDDLKPMAISP